MATPGILDATMDVTTLRRTRPLSVIAVALLSMWLFGNLYEELVTNVALLADPRPGSFPDEFAAGSPFYYYIPWGPLGVAAMVVIRVRYGTSVTAAVRRVWNYALFALLVGVGAKVVLITAINPGLRDPHRSTSAVHDSAMVWAFGNGLAVVAAGVALTLFAATRRPSHDGAERT